MVVSDIVSWRRSSTSHGVEGWALLICAPLARRVIFWGGESWVNFGGGGCEQLSLEPYVKSKWGDGGAGMRFEIRFIVAKVVSFMGCLQNWGTAFRVPVLASGKSRRPHWNCKEEAPCGENNAFASEEATTPPLEGTDLPGLRAQTPICGVLQLFYINLPFFANVCGFLRYLHLHCLRFLEKEDAHLPTSAFFLMKICVLGSPCPLSSVPLSTPWATAKAHWLQARRRPLRLVVCKGPPWKSCHHSTPKTIRGKSRIWRGCQGILRGSWPPTNRKRPHKQNSAKIPPKHPKYRKSFF